MNEISLIIEFLGKEIDRAAVYGGGSCGLLSAYLAAINLKAEMLRHEQ